MIKKVYRKLFNEHYLDKCKYIHFYKTLPIDEKAIFLESAQGRSCSGNVYYLIKEILSDNCYRDYKIYLGVKKKGKLQAEKLFDEDSLNRIQLVTFSTADYYKAIASSKFLVTDSCFLPFFIKRDGQVYLNTWKGTPFKTLGKSILNDQYSIGNVQKNLVAADYLLCSNEYTKKRLVDDFMLENISSAKILQCGLPRNTAFFNDSLKNKIKDEFELHDKQVIAYMPARRYVKGKQNPGMMHANYQFIFEELDKRLSPNQVLYVTLHTSDRTKIDLSSYEKIKAFPEEYETYEFLNACDTLITDYSSVMFDFLNTGKKIILYAYDQRSFLSSRGSYMSLEEMPFPVVTTIRELLTEINSPKQYDDASMINAFCGHDEASAAKRLCKKFLLGDESSVAENIIPSNGKENVFIYIGRIGDNGITASLKNLLGAIDLDKRNYILTMKTSKSLVKHLQLFQGADNNVTYFPMKGSINLSFIKKIIWILHKKNLFPNNLFLKIMKEDYQFEYLRLFGGCRMDSFIHYTGYDNAITNLISQFNGNKVIYVHANMKREVSSRQDVSKSVLKHAYRTFNRIAVAAESLYDSTLDLAGSKGNLAVCHKIIDTEDVLNNALMPLVLDEGVKVYPDKDSLYDILESKKTKFVDIAKFSSSDKVTYVLKAFAQIIKDQKDASLIILGKKMSDVRFLEVENCINEFGLAGKVVFIQNLENPYPVLLKSDYCILRTPYRKKNTTLAELNVLNKPTISTDIAYFHSFMSANDGCMVENSIEGLVDGMQKLLSGEVEPLNINYEQYNRVALDEFDSLFN